MSFPLTLIAAVAENGVIGKDNKLPWHISSDLKRFKSLTMGKPMIMGRKNYQSIGRPLPGRDTIVVTRDKTFRAQGIRLAHSFEEALALGAERAAAMAAQEIILAGGAEIYAGFMDRVTIMHLTFVDLAPEGDTFFPTVDWSHWIEDSRVRPPKDARDEADFCFVDYRRK